jgi:hypothetical protein
MDKVAEAISLVIKQKEAGIVYCDEGFNRRLA